MNDSFIKPILKKLLNIYRSIYVTFIKIRGRNNVVTIHKTTKHSINWNVEGDNNIVSIAENCLIKNLTIYIRGAGHKIYIGNNVVIEGGELWLEDNSCKIFIDDNTTVGSAHFAVTEPYRSILVGKDCMLSDGIELRTGDSHSIFDIKTGCRINYAADIILEDHVWIGGGAKILKGVIIGSNSIIGTGAIVTKSVPSNCLTVGVPARTVKLNVNWSRQRVYNPKNVDY
jgi:acetyltransferase-like isoleucine patch superfamily enzyme